MLHLSTKNTSFLNIYKSLRQRGIRNSGFFLNLFDEDLEFVDPHDPNLDSATKTKIIIEIRRNPFYFVREVSRIPIAGGSIPFELNLGNLAILFCMFCNLNFTAMLPRQKGKTQGTITGFVWIFHFNTINSDIMFGNKKLEDSKLNLRRFKDQQELIPQWMLRINKRLDQDNITNYRLENTKNNIQVLPAPRSVKEADKLGRGCTIPMLWLDEFAFINLSDVLYKAASPAQLEAARRASTLGRPRFKCFTTTPNDLDSREGQYAKKTFDNAARFKLQMFDWSLKKIEQYIRDNSTNDFIHIQFSYIELGMDKEWYKTQCRALDNDLKTIKREVLLQWTRTADNSVFEEASIEEIERYVKPIKSELPLLNGRYLVNFFEDVDINYQYVIGVDVAGGLGKDFSAITIFDPINFKVVGSFASNKIDTNDYELLIQELVSVYFRNSLLCIERNSYGLVIIQRLVKSDIVDKLYYNVKDKSDTAVIKDIKSQSFSTSLAEHIEYGINTTVSSRNIMMELLRYYIINNPDLFVDENITGEIRTLQYNKGKIEHGPGCHDDRLMSLLMALFAINQNDNYSRFRRTEDQVKNKASGVMMLINANDPDNNIF
jgi:hypothetical protein